MSKSANTKPRVNIAVLYHADCADGFGAAWAAWKKLKDKAVYISVPPNNRELPKIAEGKQVYTLDYSFPGDVIESVRKKVESLTVIDHHVTNQANLSFATEAVFDIDRSGAVLAWNYFHPQKSLPRLLQYIQDSDLWRFALPKTREITEAILLYDMNFHEWDKLARDFEKKKLFKRYLLEGEILLRRMEKRVGRLTAYAEEGVFEGHKCLIVNSPFYTSELGAALVRKGSPVGIIWSRRGHKIIVSLRSGGTIDVAALAQKYGGGGHKSAAGFSFEVKDFLKFKKRSKK